MQVNQLSQNADAGASPRGVAVMKYNAALPRAR